MITMSRRKYLHHTPQDRVWWLLGDILEKIEILLDLYHIGKEPADHAAAPQDIDSPYLGMDIASAAVKYLHRVGRAVPNPMLAEELRKGGYETKSGNFANTVNCVLKRRANAIGDIQKTKYGWSLIEHTEQ